jgi:D-alanyl-D-alanine carboxypeptidase/D-alanyl-D-alanine-endopeptidase (penicillin-binding protein 4)
LTRPLFTLALLISIVSALPGGPALAGRLAEIISSDPITQRTFVGVQVVDADSGEVLFDRDAQHLFTPASNMKLYTSACALATWGADHGFTTDVGAEGDVGSDGVLRGNLILRGGGDPTLRTEDLQGLARRVHDEMGLRRISGDVVVDESLFDPTRKGPGWMWDDDPDPYNMSLSSIMLDYNVLSVTVAPAAAVGAPPQATLQPPGDYPPISNSALTADDDHLVVTRRPFTDAIEVTGAIAQTATPVTRKLTMHDPALWAAGVFRHMLADAGVEVQGDARAVTQPTNVTPRLTLEGRPLAEILSLFNKPSENAIGEMLIHDLAVHDNRVPATWGAGAQIITQWLTGVVGLDPGDFRTVDGSGLSRYDEICPAGTVRLLRHMWQRPDREIYLASLPIASVDGSLRGRMAGTAAAGHVHAKTGTMSGVSCLSGYVETAGGRWLIFSILTNGYIGSSGPSQALQDRLCIAMAQTP